MLKMRALAVGTLGLLLSTHALHGQKQSRYRDFQLEGSLASVSAFAGMATSDAKTIHQRPALMQELQWQRPYSVASATALADPVKQIVFSFYNDQLSKMVVSYDRDRTAGLTDADLIAAITTEYGPPLTPGTRTSRAATSDVDQEPGTPVARWGDTDYSVTLYRLSYASGLQMIVTSPRLQALARTADAQAVQLDSREAPQRELARQKQEAEDLRASQEKVRLENKAAFRP